MEVKVKNNKKWYPVVVAPGKEENVKRFIEQKVRNLGLMDRVFDVIIPEEKCIELKDGKRVEVTRKIWPGYIVIQMVLDKDTFQAVKSTINVIGFVKKGNAPEPLSEDDVVNMLARKLSQSGKLISTVKKGSQVRIVEGPFSGFAGVVDSVQGEKVRLKVSLMGKDTTMEMDLLQVEKK